MNTNDLNEARRKKALERLFNFDGRVMSLGEFLNSIEIVRKSTYTQTHTAHRIHLEYKKIKPKTWFTVWYIKNGQEVGIDVPKLVWDTIDAPTN